jgi:hypothetical protein
MEMDGKKWLWMAGFLSPIIFMVAVIILGLMTPGYDHLRDTISILQIKKYGWIQEINFIQVGMGLGIISWFIGQNLITKEAKKVWRNIVIFCVTFLATEIIFPIDEMTSNNLQQNTFTPGGVIHLSALLIFFVTAPYGIYVLAKALKKEPVFSKLAGITATLGYILSFLCYGWTYLFVSGQGSGFLGIIQKLIVGAGLLWFIKMAVITKRK